MYVADYSMARDFSVRAALAVAHHRICALHQNKGIGKCWGTTRKGGPCRNSAQRPMTLKVLPTCKIHRRQVKESAWCRATLACGYDCGELLEWESLGFGLCPRHRKDFSTSYFLELPVELRCRIYGYLLPDTNIPARFCKCPVHRRDVYTAILRVNQQINEEATRLLYRTGVFTIEASEGLLGMCNTSMQNVCYSYPVGDRIPLTV
jgi:hypothetical protein